MVLSTASPWSHVSMYGLGSAGTGRRGLVPLCSELRRSIELTVEMEPFSPLGLPSAPVTSGILNTIFAPCPHLSHTCIQPGTLTLVRLNECRGDRGDKRHTGCWC